MPQARLTRRRLAIAVATALAATLGASAAAVPASAVPAVGGVRTAPAATTAGHPIPYPQGGRLDGAGVTGFLTTAPETGTSTWRRYADGSGQAYSSVTYLRSTRTTDFLVFQGSYRITQRNMTTGGSLEIPVGSATGDATYVGAAGDAVFTTLVTDTGTVLRKHTEADNNATVTGLPVGATSLKVAPATPDHARVTFLQGSVGKWGLIDLATGTVGSIRDRTVGFDAVSATHTAWAVGETTDRPPQVFAADLVTGAVQEIPVAQATSWGNFHVGLVGDWVVYGQMGGWGSSRPGVHYPLTAYNLTTKTSARLLDHAHELAPAPDGSLYVRGGLLGQGEGMYRIADTGSEAPKVEKVATTGEPTEAVVTNGAVPAEVLDLDVNDGFTFRWNASRQVENATVTVRHVRTGKTQSSTLCCGIKELTFGWEDDNWDEEVHNGDFTWEIVARPSDGIGPNAVSTGTFKVVRRTAPHDFNDNGTPDLLARDSTGRLWRNDLFYRPIDEQLGIHAGEPKALLGSGWNIYDRLEAGGDLGGSAVGDLLARDRSGVLWLYPGDDVGNFGGRIKVGGGWQIYDKLAFGSDLTNDGRPDALAADTSGGLWLYPGTGDAMKPFSARKKIGDGWGIYNDLVAVGNLAGGPAGDLVARDESGVLWLYLGKDDGTFAPRTKVGGGWNTFGQLIGAGDADGDGRPDLIGISATFYSPSLYKGTDDWKTPFRSAETTYLGSPVNASNLVF
ncbi:VCBS repeat-containing protein [Streptomyces sp. Je 1-79]|uniref:FG-GAP repeat domain-containing protein n=1 Tax=Streptomyces sp. Je 1-79 TaxID=2943847 RepID=UPI0021A947BF|nr:VCBS repeat-containing protein [Streptomyces sp. Je 1-79]MCT4355331.1 VCBS repeat-containing protein [Streptomyces sp. Je 1-79]